MPEIPAVHVNFEGFTAFFRHPLVIAGTQITLPCPPYSTILGLISACAGRVVTHKETRLGFEFHCNSSDIELEKTNRLAYDGGLLRAHREGQGILKRYIYFHPKLDLYVTNLNLKKAFENPASTPCLGRSQDIAWINKVEEVTLIPFEKGKKGKLGPTLIPEIKYNIPSLVVRCPEWFENNTKGRTRIAGPLGFYQALLPTTNERFFVEMDDLFHPSDMENSENVIYLHKWLGE